MIRNYYTEAFKNGVVPVISATQLIDGTVKITESVAAAGVVNPATSTTFALILNGGIQVGMYLTAPASGAAPAITINDQVLVAAVVHAAQTTVTLNKPVQTVAGQNLTFFNVNQNSWREYSLYIGTQPTQGDGAGAVTTATAVIAAAAQNQISILASNPYVQVGMSVYDDGVLIGTVLSIVNSSTFNLAAVLAAGVVAGSILTFAFSVLPSVSVLTIDNRTVTFTNPAQGFVLPVSVVQITGVAGGLSNIIALN